MLDRKKNVLPYVMQTFPQLQAGKDLATQETENKLMSCFEIQNAVKALRGISTHTGVKAPSSFTPGWKLSLYFLSFHSSVHMKKKIIFVPHFLILHSVFIFLFYATL